MDRATAERKNEETRRMVRNMLLAQQIESGQKEMAAVVTVGVIVAFCIAFVAILVIASAMK